MSIETEERPINSPLIASVWRSRSEQGGSFTSVAVSRWELVVTRRRGRARLTLRGPETRATPAPIPEESEFLGITFEHAHTREPELSPRSVRRHFLRATGLTPGRLRQIDRARQAAALLQGGASASEAMQRCDYFDQPHLIRSLRRFIGYTPSAIGKADGGPLMSLSYKTAEFRDAIDQP